MIPEHAFILNVGRVLRKNWGFRLNAAPRLEHGSFWWDLEIEGRSIQVCADDATDYAARISVDAYHLDGWTVFRGECDTIMDLLLVVEQAMVAHIPLRAPTGW